MFVIIALLVTICMAAVDYCQSQYTVAIAHKPPKTISAAFWSVGQWGSATVGFVVAVKLSMWYLPFEALGLFIGTILGARRVRKTYEAAVQRGRQG